jgi:hypothetical protein
MRVKSKSHAGHFEPGPAFGAHCVPNRTRRLVQCDPLRPLRWDSAAGGHAHGVVVLAPQEVTPKPVCCCVNFEEGEGPNMQ